MVDRDPPSSPSQPTIPAGQHPPTHATMVSDTDSRVLKAAIDKGLITSAVAADAARRATTDTSATELLIKQGLLTKHIADALMQTDGLNEPQSIAGFKIVGKLGQGGMGTVYRALQVSMHREVALKVISRQFAVDPAFCDRFLREARAAGAVNHPNVITCFDVGQDQGWLYMALELMTGGDAAGLARASGGRIEESRALRIIADCARGLSALKRAGLIHRDIKPANIFISEDGVAKLADLGLARSTSGEDRMTMTGAAMGTPAFMSPEQASGEAGLDLRTDIYALGATLFSLVTGDMPFKGGSAFAVVAKVINDPTPDPRSIFGSVSDGAAAIIMTAMAKDRDRRYTNPDLLIEDLDRVLSGREPRHARLTASPATRATVFKEPPAVRVDPASGSTVAVPGTVARPPSSHVASSAFDATVIQAPPPAEVPRRRRSRVPLIVGLAAVAVVLVVATRWRHHQREAERPTTIAARERIADRLPARPSPAPVNPAPLAEPPRPVVQKPVEAPVAVEPQLLPVAREPAPVAKSEPPPEPIAPVPVRPEPEPAPVAVEPTPETAPAVPPAPAKPLSAQPAEEPGTAKRFYNNVKKAVGLGPKDPAAASSPAPESAQPAPTPAPTAEPTPIAKPPRPVPTTKPEPQPVAKVAPNPQLETSRRQMFERKIATAVEDAGDGGLAVRVDPAVKSLDLIKNFPITRLDLTGCVRISDLLPLHGTGVRTLSLNGCKDIESLKGLELCPLTQVDLTGCVSLEKDLSSLKGKPLTDLRLVNCEHLASLAGIEGMPLSILDLSGCRRLQSIVQLQGMPLSHLSLAKCSRLTSLDGLVGMPLVELDISGCDSVVSVAPLRGLPLTRLKIDACKRLPSLDGLQGMPLTELDLSRCSSLKGDLSGLQGMRLTRLVLMRCDRLSSLAGLTGNPLVSLEITSCENLTGDLSDLAGLPLTQLFLRDCPSIGSLNGLQKLPIKRLILAGCKRITDLSPVRDIPGIEIVRSD